MADRKQYTADAVRAILMASRNEHDVSGWLANVLAQVAGQLGSGYLVTIGRPGSWEAAHVQGLVEGTVGDDDRYLPPPMHKLTDQQAREIRDAALYQYLPRKEIAEQYGVSESTVGDIATGRTWAWLAEGDSQ